MLDLRVLIVADDPLARAGLATLLTHQPGCSVVGQMTAHADIPAGLRLYQPDVVVWDLGWEPALGPADAPAGLERLAEVRDTGQPVVALLPTTGMPRWSGPLGCAVSCSAMRTQRP